MNNKFVTMMLLFVMEVVLLIVFHKTSCALAETTTIIDCTTDASQPLRNILEITGDYSTVFFNVNTVSTNCYIYIHDVVFGGISFSASITTNSNITIQNATSSNKLRPAFINVGGEILDFGFININNINHSFLEITPTAATDWISAVKFGLSISGKTNSWINISNVVMNEISCSSSTQPCQTAMAKFDASISYVSSLELKNFTATNISMTSSSSGQAALYCHYFQGALQSVAQISLSRVAVSNVRLENAANGVLDAKLSFFSSMTAPSPSPPVISSFVVQEYAVKNHSMIANGGSISWVLLYVDGSITDYSTVSFSDVSVLHVNSSSSLSFSNVYVYFFNANIISGSSASPSSLTCNRFRIERVYSTGTTSQVLFFYVVQSITNYNAFSFSDLSVSDLNSTASTSYSNVYVFFSTQSVTTSSSSASSSSLTANSIRVERLYSAGTASQVLLFYVGQSITNYTTLSVANVSISDVNSTGSSMYSNVKAFQVISSLLSSSSTSSSLTVSNIRMQKVNAVGSTDSNIITFVTDGSITNYTTLSFSNVSVSDARLSSANSFSYVYLLYAGGSVVSSSSTSSSIMAKNFSIERVSSHNSGDTKIYAFSVGQSISNYTSISFDNMSVSDVNATSSNTFSRILLVSVSGSIVAGATSAAAKKLSFNNLSARNLVAIAPTDALAVLFNMSIPSSIEGFDSVTFSDSIMQNVMAHSTNDAYVMAFWTGGFQDCNNIRITNSRLLDVVSTSSTGRAVASLVSVQSSTTNCRSLEVNNNVISNTSAVELYLLNSSFDQVDIISLRNNRITLNSLPSSSLSSNISVSMLPLSVSSETFNLEILNCSLDIQNQYWHQLCSPTNCSLVRINDVQKKKNNHNNISISDSSITSPSSSFLSFANFGSGSPNRSSAIANFILEKNSLLNFTSPSSVSVFGFDNSSHLPPFVFVDVKCNHWSRLTDRALSQQLIGASSLQEAGEFVKWSCQTHSASKTLSAALTATTSASISQLTASDIGTASRTRSQLTVSDNASYSSSRGTHSISVDVSSSPSPPNISLSSSSSVSRMKSSSFSLSQSASATFYPPPYVSPLREVYEAMATTSSLLSIGSMSAANVMGAARARSSLGQFSDILAGTCSLDADSASDAENSPSDISDSPTQLNLRRNYLTGQTIGNVIVIIGVGALWMLGHAVKRWRSNINNNNVNKNENKQKNKKHTTKNKKQTTDRTTFVEALAESNAHEMMLFFFTLLLEPTLSSSAMSLIGEIFVEGRTITVLSVVCVVLSWFVLLFVGMGFALWKLIYVRNFDDDEFEFLEDNEENKDVQKGKSWFRRFVEYTTSPFGEWKYKGHRKKEKILFELARPFIEPYTDSWPKFIVIDLGVIVLLSLTTIVPAMIPNESGACTIRGVALCLVLGLHVLLVVFYRLYTDRLSNTLGCVVDTLSIAAVAGAMSIDENDVDQIEHFSRVALVQSIGQMTMSVLQVIEVMLPVWDGGIEFVAKLWVKLNKKQNEASDNGGNGNSQVPPTIPLLSQEMNLMPPRQEREKKSVSTKNREKGRTVSKTQKFNEPLNKVRLSKNVLPTGFYYDDL